MLQVPIEINLDNISPDQFKDMQAVDWQALADLSANPSTQEAIGRFAWMAGGMMIFVAILILISLIFLILNLFNIWHWGTTDNSVYEAGGEKKKKWFLIFFIVPLTAVIIGIIPIIGWIISFVLYIYYLVMVLVYFFSVRKKIGGGPVVSSPAPSQENKVV